MKQSSYLKRIREYSKLSTTFIFLKSPAFAQVVYTDVNPDLMFDMSPEGIWIDLDANGTMDFGLQNYSFTVYSFSLQETSTFQFLLAFPYNTQNAIIGIADADGTCYPFALPYAYIIKSSLSWEVALTQFLATNRYHSGIPIGNCSYCDWYNESIPERIDHFLGVRFLDNEDSTHYGWIRCDVLDEGRTLVVKDYAYESTPNIPIIAGDTTHFVDIQTQTSLPKIELSIHPIPATDHIIIDYPTNTPTTLNIYTSSGAIIYQNPRWTGEAIDISNFPQAMYYLQLLQLEQVGHGCFVKE